MSGESDKDKEKLAEGTLISHLLELRDRLIRALLAVIVVFVALCFWLVGSMLYRGGFGKQAYAAFGGSIRG